MLDGYGARKTTIAFAGFVLAGIAIRSFILFHWLRPMAHAGQGFGIHYLYLIYYPTYSHFDGLLVGVALAVVKTFRPAWWSELARHGHLQTVAGIALIAASVPLFQQRYTSATGVTAVGDVIGFPVLSLGLGLLVASAMSRNGLLSRVRVPGAKLLATLAYSLYLTQKEMIHLVSDWFPRVEQWGGWRWLLVYAVCSWAWLAPITYAWSDRSSCCGSAGQSPARRRRKQRSRGRGFGPTLHFASPFVAGPPSIVKSHTLFNTL